MTKKQCANCGEDFESHQSGLTGDSEVFLCSFGCLIDYAGYEWEEVYPND